ncbi:putative leucine-rich repeat-containing protein DDB_G0290503 [Diachasmimorpha longicaudata]|uniref:putative leucine-rich repeat-containing protein DDB_G0290503 n=1 Tax=Diachasmimorpha longicaudata TaxID=58733 RepID=UPI0030B8B8E2
MCEEIKQDIGSADIKTSDQIAAINRDLFVELSKINNRKGDIKSIEVQRAENKEKHERKVDELNEKYNVTFRALISKIKILNAKVNALEDYKNKRDNLREKIKIRDELIVKKEEETKEKLQNVQLQYKIDRAALLDDLQNQIFQRGIAYEAENSKKTSPLTRCLFNNNIFIKNEIQTMYQEINQATELCGEKDRTKSFNRAWTRKSQLELIKALETLRFQKVLSKHLHKHCKKPDVDKNEAAAVSQEQPDNDHRIENQMTETLIKQQNLSKMQTSLHQKNVKLFSAKNQRKQSLRKVNSLVETLSDLKSVIACALELPVINEPKIEKLPQHFARISKNEFMSHLLSIVEKHK